MRLKRTDVLTLDMINDAIDIVNGKKNYSDIITIAPLSEPTELQPTTLICYNNKNIFEVEEDHQGVYLIWPKNRLIDLTPKTPIAGILSEYYNQGLLSNDIEGGVFNVGMQRGSDISLK